MAKDNSLRVAVRVVGWSQWQVQVIRGVQAYAHQQPRWRLYVDGTPATASSIFGGDVRWDGILTRDHDMHSLWRRLMREGRTQVISLTSSPAKGKPLPSVRVNDAKVAQTAGEHLVAGGYRRFAYVGPLGWGRPDHRGAALTAFAAEKKLPYAVFPGFPAPATGEPWIFTTGASMVRLTRWIARLDKPVGILTWNMFTARIVAEGARRAGIMIPEQVAIVAGDEDAMIAENHEPTLTGIVLPGERLGYEAARLLDQLMAGTASPREPVLIPPSGVIHVRQSSDVSTLPNRQVYMAVQYIRENAGRPMSVPQVAKALGMSRSSLDLQFGRVMGHTPREQITLIHLERARQLLLETKWPIERVAEEAGFGSWRQFYRIFTQRHGTTPTLYRQRFQIA